MQLQPWSNHLAHVTDRDQRDKRLREIGRITAGSQPYVKRSLGVNRANFGDERLRERYRFSRLESAAIDEVRLGGATAARACRSSPLDDGRRSGRPGKRLESDRPHPCAGSVPPGPRERWTITVSVQWPNL